MIDPAGAYSDAATRLDDHLKHCPYCGAGLSCSDGDDAAEREYRTWRAWRDGNTDRRSTGR